MHLIQRLKTGRGVLPAFAAGLCVLGLVFGVPSCRSVYAEEAEAIVADEEDAPDSSAQQDAPDQKEEAAREVDPADVDGLFEVVSEKSDSTGKTDEDSKKKKKDEKKLIVGYVQVGVQASIHFEMGEKPSLEQIQQQFPSQLDVYFLGEKKPQTVSVTWESYSDDYNSTNLNYYFFTPRFDPDKYEVKALNLQEDSPYIEVIQNAFTYEMIESAPPKENEAAVVQFCKEKLRLNTAATCGVLANIYCESGFRTNAIGDGGTSVGICQWHNSRWTNLRRFAPDDWQTLEGQLRFMRKELYGGYRATLDYIRNVTDDEQGAYDAAYYWCLHYEMPDRILSRSTTRGYLAKNVYWKRYGLSEDETETESDTDSAEAGHKTGSLKSLEYLTDEAEDTTEATAAAETETDAETETAVETEKAAETEAVTETEKAVETEAAAQTEKAAETEAVTETEKAAETEAAAGEYRCISDDGLNIRREKTTDSEAVGSIPPDGIVKVLYTDGEWARVEYEDTEGFSKLEFLEKIPEEKEKDEDQHKS